jgi:hypothetical protein
MGTVNPVIQIKSFVFLLGKYPDLIIYLRVNP